MKTGYRLLFLCIAIFSMQLSVGQVGVGTTIVNSGIEFQLESDSKGLLIPQVALGSINDIVTITPSTVEGLMVYNTTSAGIGTTAVYEGYYFWDGALWKRLFTEGYSEQFMQETPVSTSDQSTIHAVPDLQQTLDLPFAGIYQVYITSYYACGNRTGSRDAVGYGEVFVEVDGNKEANAFITSSSKRYSGGSFNKLAQQATIIFNIELSKGVHTFNVMVQEWENINTASGDGYFGRNTSAFAGNIGPDGTNGNADDYDDGQRSTMTITLVTQY